MGTAQDFEVLRNRRARNGKCAGNFSGGASSRAQQIENGAAGGIGQGVKGGVSRWRPSWTGAGMCK
jgi:hypothetical protein